MRRASSGSACLDQLERALDVGEQHRDLLALALERRARAQDASRPGAWACGPRATAPGSALAGASQFRNGGEQLLAVAERSDAQLLQIVRRERAQDLGVDVVRRERFGILAEAVVLQPGADVHSFSQALIAKPVPDPPTAWHVLRRISTRLACLSSARTLANLCSVVIAPPSVHLPSLGGEVSSSCVPSRRKAYGIPPEQWWVRAAQQGSRCGR